MALRWADLLAATMAGAAAGMAATLPAMAGALAGALAAMGEAAATLAMAAETPVAPAWSWAARAPLGSHVQCLHAPHPPTSGQVALARHTPSEMLKRNAYKRSGTSFGLF